MHWKWKWVIIFYYFITKIEWEEIFIKIIYHLNWNEIDKERRSLSRAPSSYSDISLSVHRDYLSINIIQSEKSISRLRWIASINHEKCHLKSKPRHNPSSIKFLECCSKTVIVQCQKQKRRWWWCINFPKKKNKNIFQRLKFHYTIE